MTSATTIAALLAVYAAGEGERMSEPKWTAGPWFREGETVYALNERGYNRFSALVQDAHSDKNELNANATLMASAPDLYDALSALLDANDAVQMVLCNGQEVPGFDPNALGAAQTKVVEAEELARQALAKARGES